MTSTAEPSCRAAMAFIRRRSSVAFGVKSPYTHLPQRKLHHLLQRACLVVGASSFSSSSSLIISKPADLLSSHPPFSQCPLSFRKCDNHCPKPTSRKQPSLHSPPSINTPPARASPRWLDPLFRNPGILPKSQIVITMRNYLLPSYHFTNYHTPLLSTSRDPHPEPSCFELSLPLPAFPPLFCQHLLSSACLLL